MEYRFSEIEKKWQKTWSEQKTFKVDNHSDRPKYYVLDMFPYPSGAGLHVGHPLGYIASDIVSRYKRLSGFNVLHPMGYDAFGLPAEQYAIQTGQHPAKTTEDNIRRYREQLDKIGFSFDWDREVRTSDPSYYKWTQWIFLQLFNSWYNHKTQKSEPIAALEKIFETEGFSGSDDRILTGDIEHEIKPFTAAEWKKFSEKEKSDVLMNFRLAYLGEAWVNWCPALGTVLANDEVKDGVSERGGYPVERKRMPQWSMRITSFADRLLYDLDTIDWPESIKEAQRNWIGRSEGASLKFQLDGHDESIEVFTTRPDTVFGVTFVTLAPEHELVKKITTPEYRAEVDAYVTIATNKTERERQADVKNISGKFTGAYVIHPFSGKKVPVWIGEYVLAGYGTGAVMAVPAHDSRDHAFAKYFNLPIVQVITSLDGASAAAIDVQKESYDAKEGQCINSDFLDGLGVKEAIKKAISEIEKRGLGKGKVNYRLRDAAFGRQRYWGEPIPIYYKPAGSSGVENQGDLIPTPLPENELPLVLPEIEKFLPTETGDPPLGRAKDWKYQGKYDYELTTMPGWAGSSWYYLRYMDPHNAKEFVSQEAVNYWKNVDLYIGGAEHATGHLLYVRFWTKFLYDIGKIPMVEPANKLINQGMIQGMSEKIYLHKVSSQSSVVRPVYISADLYEKNIKGNPELESTYVSINVNVNFVKNGIVDLPKLVENNNELQQAVFFSGKGAWTDGKFYDVMTDKEMFTADPNKIDFKSAREDDVTRFGFNSFNEVEKMSKRWGNVITPDSICEQFGADTLRLYEMFLGPLEQSKPWNTNGISGVHGFLKRFWRLFFGSENGRTTENFNVSNDAPTDAELKVLHRTLKKVKDDIERYSFNTCVSQFMIATNELMELKSNKRAVLEPLVVALSPFAPHIAEELWEKLGHSSSVIHAAFPAIEEKYLVDDTFDYPVQVNGKVRFTFTASLQMKPDEVQKEVLSTEEAKKWLEGKTPKKVIVVPKRIVNIVV